MGSWNETCGITQLPINYGNKVRLFVLVSQGEARRTWSGGMSYANEIWSPIGQPIQGTYNDYGCIENIVYNQNAKQLLAKLKENWVPFKDKYEEVPSIEKMTLEQALYFIERELAKYNHLGEKTLGLFFVLEEVYQAMLSYNPIETEYLAQHHFEYKPYHEVINNQVKNWYTKLLVQYQEDLKHIKNKKDKSIIEFKLNMDDVLFWDYRDLNRHDFKKVMIDLVKKQLPWESPKVKKLVDPLIESIKFGHAMQVARKFWHPQSGKGSQQNELDIYQILNKTTEQIIKMRQDESSEEGEIADENGYFPYMLAHNLIEKNNEKR